MVSLNSARLDFPLLPWLSVRRVPDARKCVLISTKYALSRDGLLLVRTESLATLKLLRRHRMYWGSGRSTTRWWANLLVKRDRLSRCGRCGFASVNFGIHHRIHMPLRLTTSTSSHNISRPIRPQILVGRIAPSLRTYWKHNPTGKWKWQIRN